MTISALIKLNKDSFSSLKSKLKSESEALIKSGKLKITVHLGTCGIASGADVIKIEIERLLAGIDPEKIVFGVSGCAGFCSREPMLTIEKEGMQPVVYHSLNVEKVKTIFEKHILRGEIAEDLEPIIQGSDLGSFYYFQEPRVMRNRGKIDPFRIEDYIANDGYQAFVNALDLNSEEIIKTVADSGLRGRGGAGFPTGKKWELCKKSVSLSGIKYIVCNGDEGDPGAFMDRNLLESDPHSVIEGMLIAALAIGSSKAYMYVRAEYPLAIKTLSAALEQARQYGFLGENIFGAGFDFDIEIYQGAGAFVCGEETALIESIEGKRGMPRSKPPFPANEGLYGEPTLINNVETFSNIGQIILRGSKWFASVGTATSKGTKIFALTGAVNYVGLVEVPMGITLRDIVFKIGGGIKGGKKFKAVQMGGPSGGCIPEKYLDTLVDYEKVKETGAIMGSGGMIVLDEDTCMVNLSRYFMDFIQEESCGQCTPCRIGTLRMLEILDRITKGEGELQDLAKLEKLGLAIKETSLCGLGKSAPNPVLSTLKYFRSEYITHVREKRCPAVECREIMSSPCQHTCPIGTEAQSYIAYIARGRYREAFDIIVRDNPLPSVCSRVCHHPCETKCEAGKWGDPIMIRSLKRFASDFAIKSGAYPQAVKHANEPKEITKEGKVAIIGSGPAGLMAGYKLGTMGYDVTIFEELEKAGGGLAVYIPEFRLPKKILELDIAHIKSSGVEIKTGIRVGRDISFDKILKDHKAIFIATGAHKSKKLEIPGEDIEDVVSATEFLKNVNLQKPFKIGKSVGVVGGGNSAVDAARSAARIDGCQHVTIIYRRTINEMPAFEEEVKALLKEGIDIKFLTAPVKVIAENGRLTGVECVRMELGQPDESGRKRPVAIKGSQFIIPLDTLIAAIGEYPDLSFISGKKKIAATGWGTLAVDTETMLTNINGVFAGGDVVSGPATAIEAMAAGKIAAEMIDKYLRKKPLTRKYSVTRPSIYLPPLEVYDADTFETDEPVLSCLTDRYGIDNTDDSLHKMTEKQAVIDARRCLRCDLETEQAKLIIKNQTDR